MKKFLTVWVVVLCAFLVFVSARSSPAQEEVESYTKVGDQMPSFTVKDLDGTEINMDALKGKIVLVTFWATWCAPCLAEMPRLEKQIWRKFKSDEFLLLAIAREQTDKEITAFRKKRGLTFPMASDPQREIFNLFGNGGIPRSYVVGADGKILYQTDGYVPSEFTDMKRLIERELKKLQKPKNGV